MIINYNDRRTHKSLCSKLCNKVDISKNYIKIQKQKDSIFNISLYSLFILISLLNLFIKKVVLLRAKCLTLF